MSTWVAVTAGATSCDMIDGVPIALDNLADTQRLLLAQWLPGLDEVADRSWGLIGTTVLEVVHRGSRYIVKAGGADDHHIARELEAHRRWLTPWTEAGRAPVLAFGDVGEKLLVTHYLEGELVEGHSRQSDPHVFRQAGELLAQLHAQPSRTDARYEQRVNARALAWLDRPHRIAPTTVDILRDAIASWPTPAVALVPTHGDWQPRNWLVHGDEVRVIDFGRAALRPAMSDLTRLTAQDFLVAPELERAFIEGYGDDPRTSDAWLRVRVREAIGTSAWAFGIGDATFEAHGHTMLADVLTRL